MCPAWHLETASLPQSYRALGLSTFYSDFQVANYLTTISPKLKRYRPELTSQQNRADSVVAYLQNIQTKKNTLLLKTASTIKGSAEHLAFSYLSDVLRLIFLCVGFTTVNECQ